MDTLKRFRILLDNPNVYTNEADDIKEDLYFVGINYVTKEQIILFVNNFVNEIEIIDSVNLTFNQILSILLYIYPNHKIIPLKPMMRFGLKINFEDYLDNRIRNPKITSRKLMNYIEIDYLKRHKLTEDQQKKSDVVLEAERRLTNSNNKRGYGLILCYTNLYYPQSYQFLPDNIRYYFVNKHKNLNPDIVSEIVNIPYKNKIKYIIVKNNYCETIIDEKIMKKLNESLIDNGMLFISNAEKIKYDENLFIKLNYEDIDKELFVRVPEGEFLILMKKERKQSTTKNYMYYSNEILDKVCKFPDGSVDEKIMMSLKSIARKDESTMVSKLSKNYNYYYIQQKLMEDYGVTKQYVDFVFSWIKKYYKLIDVNTCPKLYYYSELPSEEQVNKYRDIILNYFDSKKYKLVRMILGLMLLEK